jgi:methylmalonyl-CoA mutase N-terminal domain/subunit
LQIDKLNALRKKRDDKAVISALQKINAVAQSNENLIPAVIDAVENYCTLGEIADCLREVYGEFK